MQLPGTWRLGWRKKIVHLYDPCADANLTDLEGRVEQLEKKGWYENAAATRQELKRLRALKASSKQAKEEAKKPRSDGGLLPGAAGHLRVP